MSYEVRITRKAFRDMQDAADYIEKEKYNPDAADNLLDTAAEMIGSLSEYPERYHLSEDAILRSWGIRHSFSSPRIRYNNGKERSAARCADRTLRRFASL